jgi:hypothetical protein
MPIISPLETLDLKERVEYKLHQLSVGQKK